MSIFSREKTSKDKIELLTHKGIQGTIYTENGSIGWRATINNKEHGSSVLISHFDPDPKENILLICKTLDLVKVQMRRSIDKILEENKQ